MEWVSPKPQPIDGPSPIHELGEASGSGTEHAHSPEEIRAERLFTVVSVVIALLGIAIGWVVFKKRPLLQMPRILENKYYVDEAYNAAIINPIMVGSREGLWKLFDVGVIDRLLACDWRGRHRDRDARSTSPGRLRPWLRGDHPAGSIGSHRLLCIFRCSRFADGSLR